MSKEWSLLDLSKWLIEDKTGRRTAIVSLMGGHVTNLATVFPFEMVADCFEVMAACPELFENFAAMLGSKHMERLKQEALVKLEKSIEEELNKDG